MTRLASADQVAERFQAEFGGPAAGVWRLPGRANLIGEHTDYNDGFVFPFALDRGTLAAVTVAGPLAVLELTLRLGPDFAAERSPIDPGRPGAGHRGQAGPPTRPGSPGRSRCRPGIRSRGRQPRHLLVPGRRGPGCHPPPPWECSVALALTELEGAGWQQRRGHARPGRHRPPGRERVRRRPLDHGSVRRPCSAWRITPSCWTACPGSSASVPLNPAAAGLPG